MWFHYMRKHKNISADIESLSDTLFSEEPSPQTYAENSEKLRNIIKAVNSLKPRHREIFWLHAVAEMPFSEIADIMKITENSAKVIYFRAKNSLKKLLNANKDYYSDD